MQDFFHADNESAATDEHSSEPSVQNEAPASEPETTTEQTSAARPAATASSYRDIIAERLARKSGGGTASTMAHSSDVERSATSAAPLTEAPIPFSEAGIPGVIEAATKLQEIPVSDAPSEVAATSAGLSSRERARMRQEERAALRRAGGRHFGQGADQTPEGGPVPERELTAAAESMEPVASEEASKVGQDVIAARMAQKAPQGQRRERRPESGGEKRVEGRPERERREEPRERKEEQAQESRSQTTSGLTLRTARPATPEEVRRPEARRPMERQPERSIAKVDEKPAPGQASAIALAEKLGISVIIPLYNEQDSLRELTAALKQQCMRLAGPKYEILFVNDGSTDHSAEILKDILATSSRVSVISFRRNLGKSAALAAGFAEAQHGIVITMDADLQDDPREFVNLIGKLAEGYDLVSGWKKKRYDPMSKTGPSKFFNWVTSMFSGIRLHDFNCGLKAYRKEVTDSLQVYGELHRYLPALAYWQGFRVTEIPVTHHPRKFGRSKFGSSRFFKGFLDLMSIVFTNRYGKRPLHLFGTIGTLMAIAGFVIDIWLTVEWALGLTSLSNRPLLLLGLLLILVGAQLISRGLLGEMIVKNSISRSSISYAKEKGKPSAEARERRASRAARLSRVGGRGERRGPRRNS